LGDFERLGSPPKLGDLGGGSGRYFIATPCNVAPTSQNGLSGDRHINLSQMRSVDARRIKNKQGVLEDIYWRDIEKAVCVELGFG